MESLDTQNTQNPPLSEFYSFLKSPKDKLMDLFFNNSTKPSGYNNVNNENNNNQNNNENEEK